MEISDLNVSLQEKDLVITALKDELRKLKGKDLVDNVVTKHTIALEILKVDVEPITPKLLNNKTAHFDYLRHNQEQAAILREVVDQGKSQNPLNNSLDSACLFLHALRSLLLAFVIVFIIYAILRSYVFYQHAHTIHHLESFISEFAEGFITMIFHRNLDNSL
ncbi:hypothetical protein Tco_1012631 [Tanacetum coccineum]